MVFSLHGMIRALKLSVIVSFLPEKLCTIQLVLRTTEEEVSEAEI
jgi:hypothetical protein